MRLSAYMAGFAGEGFFGLPRCLPCALALAKPSIVRSLILSLSKLAIAASTFAISLPAALSNLKFFTFLLKQFTSINFRAIRYVVFLVFGLIFSGAVAYIAVHFMYRLGRKKIGE